MLKVKEKIEHNIFWQIKNKGASFWFDNWTKLCALHFVDEINDKEEEIEVKNFITEGGDWNEDKLKEYISEDIVQHIKDNIKPGISDSEREKHGGCLTLMESSLSKIHKKFPKVKEEKIMIITRFGKKLCQPRYVSFYGEHGRVELLQMIILLY